LLGLFGLVALMALTVAGSGFAANPPKNTVNTADDTYDVTLELNRQQLPVSQAAPARAEQQLSHARRATMDHGESQVGDSRVWLGLDDVAGQYVLKFYTLKAIGTHGEVWVADNLNFPTGDCRNDGVRNVISQAQVDYLLAEFDTKIWPKEAQVFSTAPDRNGANETIRDLVPPNIAALMHPEGAGNRTVILIDNVRDDNYYDTNNANGFSYIAGFFSGQLNDFFDRNVMTIDAFDWLHRTGANPPNNPVPGNNCTSAPARPFLYEGVFAHEYQHLLEHYEDIDETNWINEGLADWAQTLVGYVDPSKPITDQGFDSHIQCFLGWLGVATPANPNPRAGGPENSLTRWGDQGDGEILCDYGAAYTMMEFLAGRYGTAFMTSLHRGDANGLAGLQEALTAAKQKKTTAQEVLHDWALMVALDGLLDNGVKIIGSGVTAKEKNVTTPTLHATINWETPHAYDTPGAPPNGADYVRLRDASGNYLRGDQIESLGFQGAATLPTRALAWTVDANPPLQAGDPALFSGAANNRDESAVTPITVGTGANAVLTFNALWNQELDWDFGFVQISTDGGASYTSIPCTDTTSQHDPEAAPAVIANLPGFSGYSGGWKTETCSLSAYAGQSVLLAFRAINDALFLGQSAATPPGFWVDDVMVGSTLVSDGTSLAAFKSPTETRPNTVSGFTVWIVSQRTTKDRVTVKQLKLDNAFAVKGFNFINKYVDRNADWVGAIVFYDDPSETSTQYAPYKLTVNGVTQPGGGM
jgi:hypothetical protein